MDKNGAAIYNTRITKNFHDGNLVHPKPKLGYRYALVNLKESDELPGNIEWNQNLPEKGTKVKLLQTGKEVSWIRQGDRVKIILPPSFLKEKKRFPALAFSFIPENQDN